MGLLSAQNKTYICLPEKILLPFSSETFLLVSSREKFHRFSDSESRTMNASTSIRKEKEYKKLDRLVNQEKKEKAR